MSLATAALLGLLGTGTAFSAQYDTVYYGGKIYTMSEKEAAKDLDPAKAKMVDVVAVKDGVIVYAGDRSGIDLEQAANKVDLKGKTMLPGFTDGHGHFPEQGEQDLFQVFLGSPPLGDMTSIADYQEALRPACENSPEGVLGARYDDTLISDMRHPTWMDIEDVSECVGKRVLLRHMSGHVFVASKRLLLEGNGTDGPLMNEDGSPTELARNTAGVEIKDGKVTGVLYEAHAQSYVSRPKITADNMSSVSRASEVFLSRGVTLADCGLAGVGLGVNTGGRGYEGLFQEGLEKGLLHNRIIMHPAFLESTAVPILRQLYWKNIPDGKPTTGDLLTAGAAPSEKTPKTGDDMTNFIPLTPAYTPQTTLPPNYLFMGAYKLVADGSPQAYTSWTKAPGHYDWGSYTADDRCTKNAVGMEPLEGTKYDDPADIFNGLPGSIVTYPQDLRNLIELAHRNSVSTETHTNGSTTAEVWVEALENAVTKHPTIEDTRHTSIHAQTMEREVVERLAGSYDTVDPRMTTQMFGAFEGTNGQAVFKGMNSVTDKAELGALMRKQNLFASFFMTHTYYYGERHRDIFFGPGRALNISPAGWATHFGLRYSFHNDNTVTPIEPLQSVESGVTRLSAQSLVSDGGQLISGNGKNVDATVRYPYRAVNGVPDQSKQMDFYDYDQRVNVLQALHAVTMGPAYQNKLDDRLGSIEVKKLADFVILDDDPMLVAEASPTQISDIRVATTIVNDKVVYGVLPETATYVSQVKAGYLPGAKRADKVEAQYLEGADADKLHALDKGQARLGCFNLTAVGQTSGIYLFQMNLLGNGKTVADLNLYDVSDASQARPFSFVDKSDMGTAGVFWVAEQKNPTVPLKADAELKMDGAYIVCFTLASSDQAGEGGYPIGASVDLVSGSGSLPDNDTSVLGPSGNNAGGDDDWGGCTVGTKPAYDLTILLGMLAGLVGLRGLRKRLLKA